MKYQTLEFATAQEATFDPDNHRVRMVLVKPGVSKNKKNWTPSALKKAHESGIFVGAKMYDEHSKQKGNRPLRELISVVEKTEIDPATQALMGDVKFVDLDFMARAQRAPEHFGASIDVLFRGNQRKEGGTSIWDVDEIVHANSVDWTGNPAAGGGIERFLTAQESEDDSVIDWSKVTLDDLQKNRPDLAKELAPAAESGPGTPPVSGITEDRIAQIVADAIAKDRDDQYKAQVAREAAVAQYSDIIGKAALPDKTKLRLTKLFQNEQTFDQAKVDHAIQEAKEEAESMGWRGPVVKGLGTSTTGDGGKSKMTIEDARESAPAHAAMLSMASRTSKKPSTTSEGQQN